ncbi:MAG: hypothetical protein HOM21_13810, partial [Halobacteriovoraceae bacterium]|nr:hypothetical protein [Halobacteriovoraceae bacterium]
FIFHNGIWFNDAVVGVGITPFTAINSSFFDISNMDVTFFYANDKVNTAIQNVDDKASIYGLNTWIEYYGGYWEIGYGYTQDDDKDIRNEQDYHNAIISYSHRWKDIASFSYRVIGNFGQKKSPINDKRTADGQLYLIESSWMTKTPYTLLPYVNVFFGNKQPQPLARAAGGILQNVGILFEGDGITNFQTLDATANNTWGGAVGLEYLFALNQQLVLEVATVRAVGGPGAPDRKVFDDEIGYGVRYQRPIAQELIFRADAMYSNRSGLRDLYGARTEIRLKF